MPREEKKCKDGAVWNEPTCGQVADYFAGHHGAETCEDVKRSFQAVAAYDDAHELLRYPGGGAGAQCSGATDDDSWGVPKLSPKLPWLCDEHKAAPNGLTFIVEYFDSNDCSGDAVRVTRGVLDGDAATLNYGSEKCTADTPNVWVGSSTDGQPDALPMSARRASRGLGYPCVPPEGR